MSEDPTPRNPAEYSSIYRPSAPFDSQPFDRSAVDYKYLAERTERILSVLDKGAVIAIDAPWGSGKTFFGRNFDAYLRERGWKTCYVDAFRGEHVEDPFLLLASAIREQIAGDNKGSQKADFTAAATKVGKALLPIAGKALIRIGTANLVSLDDVKEAEKAISEAASQATEKLVADQIAGYEEQRKSYEAFAKALSSFAGRVATQTGRPFVVFIDELDRCTPTFAVRLLERAKHFFDVPSVTFVMLLDKTQLERAVKGVYGEYTDAEGYLRKFIHFTFELPKRQRRTPGQTNEIDAYINYLASQINLGPHQSLVPRFSQALTLFAPAFFASFRDIERVFTQFVLAAVDRDIGKELLDVLAFLVLLRVKQPTVYQELYRREEQALAKVRALGQKCVPEGCPEDFFRLILDVCHAHIHGEAPKESGLARYLFRYHVSPERTLFLLARLIDPLPE